MDVMMWRWFGPVDQFELVFFFCIWVHDDYEIGVTDCDGEGMKERKGTDDRRSGGITGICIVPVRYWIAP